MEKHTVFGMAAALLVWSMFLGAGATFYAYSPITLNNSIIAGLAEPTTDYQAATKNYTDSVLGLSCSVYSVNSTDCGDAKTPSYCYASKFTADKVCDDKDTGGTPYAVHYEYKYHGVLSADKWTGTGWSSVSGSDQEDLGYGGSGREGGTPGGGYVSDITEVYCCG